MVIKLSLEISVNKLLVGGAVLIGLVFLLLAGVYLTTPAQHLPTFLPGYAASNPAHHMKHAIGSVVLALALFAFAWFRSKPASA